MKLIIDIPEDLYKWIKDKYDNPNGEIAYSAIKNGIPYEEKPQGKWITIKSPLSNETIVKCDKCGDEFIGNDVEDYNFCPICGADMRKGGKE